MKVLVHLLRIVLFVLPEHCLKSFHVAFGKSETTAKEHGKAIGRNLASHLTCLTVAAVFFFFSFPPLCTLATFELLLAGGFRIYCENSL